MRRRKSEKKSGSSAIIDPAPDAGVEGQEGLAAGPGTPAFHHQKDCDQGGDGCGGEENALNDLVLRAEKDGEVEYGPDDQESADVDVLADVAFGRKREFREDPRGKQQQA